MPEGEIRTFYHSSRRGSNDPVCWEFRCSFFRFQVSGPMDKAYDSAQFVFVEDADACTEVGASNIPYQLCLGIGKSQGQVGFTVGFSFLRLLLFRW